MEREEMGRGGEERSSKVTKYSAFRIKGTFPPHNFNFPRFSYSPKFIHICAFHPFAESNQHPSNM